ncbi:MAG TPA: indole-3-glycerol phosphate synthase TrpC [Gemmatimonadaceae bacterium]
MQASPAWNPPGGTLGRIVAEARQRVDALESQRAELAARARDASGAPSFHDALRRDNVAVIAEVKRRSPSKGWINADISAADQALAYAKGGAAAISVLTEGANFGGSNDDLIDVRNAVNVPAIKKDFHVDTLQLLEAKSIGASAALLIARALSPDELPRMADFAREIGLDVLVEIRDEDELRRALDAGAAIIGINNRNLETLVIDPATAEGLLKSIPSSVIAVAESGVQTAGDVERYAIAGADAILVGSAVSAAPDPALAVQALAAVKRIGRGH